MNFFERRKPINYCMDRVCCNRMVDQRRSSAVRRRKRRRPQPAAMMSNSPQISEPKITAVITDI